MRLQKFYLLNVETYQESERYFVHISSKIDANKFKQFTLVWVMKKNVAVEELEGVVDKDEDEEVVVYESYHGASPHGEELEEAGHPPRCVLVLVLVNVVVPCHVFLVDRHLSINETLMRKFDIKLSVPSTNWLI